MMFRILLVSILCLSVSSPLLIAAEKGNEDVFNEFSRDNALTTRQIEEGKKAIAAAQKLVARIDSLLARSNSLVNEAESEKKLMLVSLESNLVRAKQVHTTLEKNCADNGGEPCSHLRLSAKKISDMKQMIETLKVSINS